MPKPPEHACVAHRQERMGTTGRLSQEEREALQRELEDRSGERGAMWCLERGDDGM